MLKHLDLCSGIGGFALGLQSTNYFKTIGFVEIDKFCQKVLTKQFPDIPIYEDLKKFKPQEHNLQPDILTAGFPCQPFSVAGKQKGKDDNRNLWKETFRIIQESKPTWFIGENVSGIVKLYLDTILADLESEGYATRCFNISASSIGAKHQRQRIWIISNSQKLRSRGWSSKKCGVEEWKFQQKEQKGSSIWSKTERCNSLHRETKNITNSNNTGCQKQWQSKSNEEKQQTIECNSWWEAESKLRGVPDGISYGLDKDRVNRIKALGNAIVPLIPYYIGLAIKESYE